ncbi:MAG TPA: DUF11 domain-containing protein [Aggregatilineaceae bacterium]|nr:DUF11 domain-containing protein [Aggregatilineaceae bacterium]
MSLKNCYYGVIVLMVFCLGIGHASAFNTITANPAILDRYGGFAPVLSNEGTLIAGALGLPGEPLTWALSASNAGDVSGTGIIITDVVPKELRINSVEADRGTFSISGQTVSFQLDTLDPGEAVQMRINTTVIEAPPNGSLINQASLVGQGPDGPVTHQSLAEVSVPTSLPATGYPPQDLPGEGEPSVYVVALGALCAVALMALFVWWRGHDSQWLRGL